VLWPVIEPGRKFVRGWAIEAICDHLEAVTRPHHPAAHERAPGLMKSLSTDVFWPAWEWGPKNRPDLRYIGASYSQDLTIRDNRRCRQLIESPVYQEMWGDRFHLVADQNAKVRYDTDKRGFKIATSVGGLSTGERGDRFVIDDPHNVKGAESEAKLDEAAQWFTEVVPTRVNDLKDAPSSSSCSGSTSGTSRAWPGRRARLHPPELPMEYEPDRKCFTDLGAGKRFEDPALRRGAAVPRALRPARAHRAQEAAVRMGRPVRCRGPAPAAPRPAGGGMFKVDKEEIKRRMLQVLPPGAMGPRLGHRRVNHQEEPRSRPRSRRKMVGDMVYIGDGDPGAQGD
jgi:hypothetical protein